MAIARVRSRGQVTVPREIRRACGIGSGTHLYFVTIGPGQFRCTALPARRPVLELATEYGSEGSAPDVEELRELVEDEIARALLPQGTRTTSE